MRFLAIMMFILAGSSTKYINADLTLDNLMSWIIYMGFYFMGGIYLDRHIQTKVKEALNEKDSPKTN